MKNQYFLKDKKVKLVTQVSERDQYGNIRKFYKYITNFSVWAYTNQMSQAQVFEASTYGNDEIRLFVLNYRSDLKQYDFIEYKGNFYTITRLDTKDDYNGELFLYVKDTPTGETPKNIQPAS